MYSLIFGSIAFSMNLVPKFTAHIVQQLIYPKVIILMSPFQIIYFFISISFDFTFYLIGLISNKITTQTPTPPIIAAPVVIIPRLSSMFGDKIPALSSLLSAPSLSVSSSKLSSSPSTSSNSKASSLTVEEVPLKSPLMYSRMRSGLRA